MTSTAPLRCASPRALHVRLHGTVVHVDVAPSVTLSGAAAIGADWADALAPATAPCEVTLTADLATGPSADARTVTAHTIDALRQAVTARLLTLSAQLAGDRHLVLAAAAAAASDGRAVVLLGAPGAGKTTAVRVLAQGGMTYLGDEMVAIRQDATVLPLASPLLLRRGDSGGDSGGDDVNGGGADPGPRDLRSPTSVGLRSAAAGEFPLGALVLLARDATGPTTPRAERLPLAEALVTVLPTVVGGYARPGLLRQVAALIDTHGGLRRIHYRDAPSLVPLLAAPPASRATRPGGGAVTSGVRADTAPLGGMNTGPSAGGLRRAEVTDSLIVDGRPVILHDGSVHVLDGLGALVWERAAFGESPDLMAQEAISRFGSPPSGARAQDAVDGAVAELAQLGLITR